MYQLSVLSVIVYLCSIYANARIMLILYDAFLEKQFNIMAYGISGWIGVNELLPRLL